jgi:uncharacterized protein YfaP (DUF2135 family)
MKTLRCLLLFLPACAHAQVQLDAPKGGWRNTAGEDTQYTQTVNYPASSVNSQPGQSETAMIRGRIAGAGKKKPATLVVNGVSMPVELDENGQFQRPYSFTSGSNGVEVRAPDGKGRARAQFYDNYRGKTQPQLRIVLSWDTPGTDLDLHVVSPDGAHAWWGGRVTGNGGALDVDVTTGYGPEIYSSAAPPPGTYHIYVNYYGGGGTSVLTVAQVAIISHEGTTREKQQVFQIPMRAPGELTLVKSFKFP